MLFVKKKKKKKKRQKSLFTIHTRNSFLLFSLSLFFSYSIPHKIIIFKENKE